MLPKTELRYSRVYNKVLDSTFNGRDICKLKIKFRCFEKLYHKFIKRILILIEKNSKKWSKKYIPIYLVNKSKMSFSDPLTIKFRKNSKYLLVVLIHELLHNNIKGKWENSREVHKYMEPILDRIVKSLSLDLNKEVEKFNNRIKKTYK